MRLYDGLWRMELLQRSLAHVMRCRRRATGVDGVAAKDFSKTAESMLPSIQKDLAMRTYSPKPYHIVEHPKILGGTRTICVPTMRDRVVLRALHELLTPIFSPLISTSAYGYRKGAGTHAAVLQASALSKDLMRFAVVADIKDCFPSISRRILARSLVQSINDLEFLDLLGKFIRGKQNRGGRITTPTRGLPQGAAFSPLLLDVYLAPTDRDLESRFGPFVRYADDYLIMTPNRDAAEEAKDVLTKSLRMHCDLRLGRIAIVDLRVEAAEFLGFGIRRSGLGIGSKALARISAEAEHRFSEVGGPNGRAVALDYLEQAEKYFVGLADVRSMETVKKRIRAMALPTGGNPSGPPAAAASHLPVHLGSTSNGGGVKHTPPPALGPGAQYWPRSGRGQRGKRFPDGDEMLWMQFALPPADCDIVTQALLNASRITGSQKQGYNLGMIALDFLSSYPHDALYKGDRQALLDVLIGRICQTFGILLIVVNPKNGKVRAPAAIADEIGFDIGVDSEGTDEEERSMKKQTSGGPSPKDAAPEESRTTSRSSRKERRNPLEDPQVQETLKRQMTGAPVPLGELQDLERRLTGACSRPIGKSGNLNDASGTAEAISDRSKRASRDGKASEKKLARKTHGRRQPASGAIDGHKGDVLAYGETVLLENKSTSKESILVKKEWLAKIDREAFTYRKKPGLCLSFSDMPPGVDAEWIAVPITFFEELIQAWRERTKRNASKEPE